MDDRVRAIDSYIYIYIDRRVGDVDKGFLQKIIWRITLVMLSKVY